MIVAQDTLIAKAIFNCDGDVWCKAERYADWTASRIAHEKKRFVTRNSQILKEEHFYLGSNNKKKIEVIELYLASALAS